MPRYKIVLEREEAQFVTATVYIEAGSARRARQIALAEADETEFTAESPPGKSTVYITDIERMGDVS